MSQTSEEARPLVRRTDTSIAPSEITPLGAYLNRRGLLAAALSCGASALLPAFADPLPDAKGRKYPRNARFSTDEKLNSFEDITGYNNYYEFGTDKADPKRKRRNLRTNPWTVTVDGEAEVKGRYTSKIFSNRTRSRSASIASAAWKAGPWSCPWVGFPLGDLLRRFKPTSKAKYVEMTTLHDPKQMPGQRYPVLDGLMSEGLRMDEAMHPLTLLVTGVYGKPLPNQNGAPLRLIVPWKYGFKSVKSIVKIRFTERQPRTAWNIAAPDEYGFYANVNPKVDHPRWSQATERRLGALALRPAQPDSSLQWIRQRGGRSLQRHGSAALLLIRP